VNESQRMDAAPMAVALAPLFAHGLAADRPKPLPRSRTRDNAAAPAASASMAPHETPHSGASAPGYPVHRSSRRWAYLAHPACPVRLVRLNGCGCD
jgi:hypothetical protein